MPELPEVETMVRDLARRVVGRRIISIDAPFAGSIVYPEYSQFRGRVSNQEIEGVLRRGKYAGLSLGSGDTLIVHRGMTGSLLSRHENEPMESHVRLRFHLDNGTELRFDDPRKFGKVFLMEATGRECSLPWARMGPEPLGRAFTVQYLQGFLQARKSFIKPLLLNQRVVAGLGNIYVDESLYSAGIHPQRRARTLGIEEIARLHAAIRAVLTAAVECRGTTFSSYRDLEGRAGGYGDQLQVFRKTGTRCGRCATAIIRLVVSGRGTHICPNCQVE